MAPPKEIDWTKPLRLRLDTPGCGFKYEDVELLHVHHNSGFVTWGTKSTAHGVGPFGHFDNDSINGRVENVPEEPKNCLVVVRDARGNWFFDTFSRSDGGHAIPRTRAQCEAAHDGATYLWHVVEVPV